MNSDFVKTISAVSIPDPADKVEAIQTEAAEGRQFYYEHGSKVISADFDGLYEHGRTAELKTEMIPEGVNLEHDTGRFGNSSVLIGQTNELDELKKENDDLIKQIMEQ